MMRTRTMTALFSLALAGAMLVPAAAVDAAPKQAETAYAAAASQGQAVFAEDETILTRAELVMALHEREGKPVVNYAMRYDDVDGSAAYAEAIRWAASEKIVSGYSDTAFGPEDGVTREQFAAILYRYAGRSGLGFTGAWAFPLTYADAAEISDYAYEAVCWMTMQEVMGEAGDNIFAPQKEVTNAEASDMFETYFALLEQAQIPNPFADCQTIEEAAEIAGFSVTLPSRIPNWVNDTVIRALPSSMIEVQYQGDHQTLVVRKGVGDADISGDYSSYPEAREVEVNGQTVTMKGEAGKVNVAIWQDDSYAYAVCATAGMELDDISALVSDIQ